jgi:hypothetical protein
MKHTIYFILISLILTFSSCKEEPPYINFTPDRTVGDTSYIKLPAPSAQPRAIYIEEFTGVQCPNCPKAQAEAKLISENNSNRVFILTMHPLGIMTPLTRPFDAAKGDKKTSKYDFRTEPGARIFEMVGFGQTGSLPIGNVNRKLFGSEVHRNIDYQKWAAYAAQDLAEPTPVNIDLKAKNTGDSVEVEITLSYTSNVSDSQYVSIALAENGIIDVQESKDDQGASIYEDNYSHNHVLRAMVTSYFGDFLNASYEPGRVFYKKYRILRNKAWNSANLEVVAFVHLNTTKKNVLHAKGAKVQ